MTFRVITYENIAILEYEPVEKPTFDLSDDGVLFVGGYSILFMNKSISVMKRYDTKLNNYKVLGRLIELKSSKEHDFKILDESDIKLDYENCVVLFKK